MEPHAWTMGTGCRGEGPPGPRQTLHSAEHERSRSAPWRERLRLAAPSPSRAEHPGEQLNLSKGRERFRQAGFAEESSQTETTPVPSAPVPAQAGNAWGAAGGRLGGRSRDGSCLRPGV